MMELECHRSAIITVITDSGKNNQWMLNLVGQSLMRNSIFTCPVVPSSHLWVTKHAYKLTLHWRNLAETILTK